MLDRIVKSLPANDDARLESVGVVFLLLQWFRVVFSCHCRSRHLKRTALDFGDLTHLSSAVAR